MDAQPLTESPTRTGRSAVTAGVLLLMALAVTAATGLHEEASRAIITGLLLMSVSCALKSSPALARPLVPRTTRGRGCDEVVTDAH